ncbi:hypothetical protein [Tropicibacter naphthalenivorans]|uniref:Uncharacterized protein n=1 Tax=Tropicibacter naphthalenivorans TaxID=441103 RepID=A0A0P1GAQ5_9RHOB|nr:hypothetical protein [Tropicibacter naphthalenivorans]CUH78560.1 hypothetical protein TRN7648_02038 [Tropicibacter naphthalenivorans]SMC80922.1 hypothetical protein SAMN04488093_104200 [Tropicibacter naphthalenivorans]
MSPFLTILGLYYLCDQTAIQRPLAAHEVATCMANYEQLKLEFVDDELAQVGTPARAAQVRQGYARFKAWEAENPATVRAMRQTARAQMSQG